MSKKLAKKIARKSNKEQTNGAKRAKNDQR